MVIADLDGSGHRADDDADGHHHHPPGGIAVAAGGSGSDSGGCGGGTGTTGPRKRTNSSDGEEEFVDCYDASQLPDVEEYKTQVEATARRPPSKLSRRRCRRRCCLALSIVLVVVVAVIIGVIVGRGTAPGGGSEAAAGINGGGSGSSTGSSDSYNEGNEWNDVNELDGYDGESETTPAGPSRTEQIRNMIDKLQWSDPSKLLEANQPQYAAIKWMADKDPAEFAVEDTTDFRQRYALAVLYYALELHITGGPYGGDVPWLTGAEVCDWKKYFPTAHGGEVEMGVRCHGGSVVKEIFLPNVATAGTIPDEIALLYDLEGLYLYDNILSGTVPPSLSYLDNLKHLDLSGNEYRGPFPAFLSEMYLETLVLSENWFQGKLPEKLPSTLEIFDVAANNMTGGISSLSSLEKIRYVNISDNSFSGPLDSELLDKWNFIVILDASNNNLAGPLPDKLFESGNLQIIDLHQNRFKGTLPQWVDPESELSFLALNQNALRGDISIIPQSMTKLRHLDLAANWFNGTLGSFEKMSDLQYLFLGLNPTFEKGPIPPSLTKLSSLEFLSLTETSRTGSIPSDFGSGLALLDLSFNHLKSSIPSEIGSVSTLQHLYLNRNGLTGSVPDSFNGLTQLQTLVLDRNSLQAPIKPFCDSRPEFLQTFIADCFEIGCEKPCCTTCCDDDSEKNKRECKDNVWKAQVDPVQEYEYKQSIYQYRNDDIIYPTHETAATKDEEASSDDPERI